MKYSYIIGIDAAAGKFDFNLLDHSEAELDYGEIQLENDGTKHWYKALLKQLPCEAKSILVCIENTGLYSISVAYDLYLAGFAVWLEDALQITYSSGRINSKTDRLDAARIARYALRNHIDYQPFKPDERILINLKSLRKQRQRLLKSKNQLNNELSQERRYVPDELRADENIYEPTQNVLTAINKAIKKIEAEITKLIESDERYSRMVTVLTSLPGIGQVTAIELVVKTNAFAKGYDHAKIASYIGIAPHKRQSGKRLNKKPKTRKNVDKKAKSCLYMGMLRHVNSNNRIGHFYKKKIAEGKQHNSVINAVSNIMLKTACACLRKDELYEEKFAKDLQVS